MKRKIIYILTALISLILFYSLFTKTPVAVANEYSRSTEIHSQTAPLLKNLGAYHHPISTKSELAQRYFDQGLILTYAFNHDEAARSFRTAAEIDSSCAMCYWGIAIVKGPNINAAMEADAVPEARLALQKAIELSKNVTESEKGYIQALAQRYPSEEILADRKSFDIAYANAMRELHERYPTDLDAATLFAEAVMDTFPWDYWAADGKPRKETVEVLNALESVLKRNPDHPGANHLYIHAVEASPNPERGVQSADRLRNFATGAGHLVHMPSHIYIRVGRYQDAVIANQKAIAVDKEYMSQHKASGLYPLAYMPHNHHFLLASATMSGQSKLAIAAARDTATMADEKQMRVTGYETLQHYYAMPLYTLTKFGKWDEILKQSTPAPDLKYPQGVWHYARGMAFQGLGQLQQATQELEELRKIAEYPSLEKVTIWNINSAADLMQIASHVLAGEIAAKQGNYTKAIDHLKQGVALEDKLNYDEPATWYSPVRHLLGAVLLTANRPADAEKVYQEDLKHNPKNGWSLFGLAQSLDMQGKTKQAEEIQKQFETTWKHADVKLATSQL
ncbi:TPR repeat-containing protein [Calothrix sp. NIES-4071]|nr:TPR repeat-containing protein [Calothrix sp. NIES-4071]BAZ58614.1 TPR repeat-containing protein [Calothrix sp. NIES-4105]